MRVNINKSDKTQEKRFIFLTFFFTILWLDKTQNPNESTELWKTYFAFSVLYKFS